MATWAIADVETRNRLLIAWEQTPGASQAQPNKDHLLLLMVAAGAASGELGQSAFDGHALGKPTSGFHFGQPFKET